MNTSRGFIFPFLMIVLLVTIGVAVAWWIQQNQVPATAIPSNQGATSQDLMIGPMKGTVPLRVQFAVKRDLGTVETIDYGDGSSGTVTDFICGLQYCTKVHTYDQTGVYTAVFQSGSGQALRSYTITVTQSP